MLYKGTNKIKAFKGDYKPVNIYKGESKIVGWEWKEQSGTDLEISNTYNDNFKHLLLEGNHLQATQPTIFNPVYPDFSGDCDLYAGGSIINISEPLRSVPDLDGVISARDYIKVTEDTVKVHRYTDIYEFDGTETMRKNTSGGENWVRGDYIAFTIMTPGKSSVMNVGLCSHFTIAENINVYYDNVPYNCMFISNTNVQVKIKYTDFGFANMPDFEDAQPILRQLLVDNYNNSTPMTLYTERNSPLTADITNTDLGQSLSALETKPYKTVLHDNGTVPLDKNIKVRTFRR